MSFKKCPSNVWTDIENVKRYSGGAWIDCDSVKRYSSGTWVSVWERDKTGFFKYGWAYSTGAKLPLYKYEPSTDGVSATVIIAPQNQTLSADVRDEVVLALLPTPEMFVPGTLQTLYAEVYGPTFKTGSAGIYKTNFVFAYRESEGSSDIPYLYQQVFSGSGDSNKSIKSYAFTVPSSTDVYQFFIVLQVYYSNSSEPVSPVKFRLENAKIVQPSKEISLPFKGGASGSYIW